MKTLKRIALVLGVVVLLLIAAVMYVYFSFPKVSPAPNIAVEKTVDRLVRGKYLANHVTVCIDCHSSRDWNKYSAPLIPGTEGRGGEKFDEFTAGIPGALYSSNITPAGLNGYTDGELLRAITQGVTRNNRALFPLMPYMSYNHLSREDAYAIIAYIRSLKPIDNKTSESTLDFPLNIIVKTMPLADYKPVESVDTNDTKAYGKYLVTIAACGDCHTQLEKGQPVLEKAFAGGREFRLAVGTLRSSNITPDNETGIGQWSKEQFIGKFKSHDGPEGRNIPIPSGDMNTIMPWTMYAGMTESDLGAIYDYLKTLPPTKNKVEKFSRP